MDSTVISGVDVNIREDGVYLLINNSIRKATRKDVLDVVESYKIQNIDFTALNSIFKSTDTFIEVKISANKNIFQADEKVTITVSKNKQEATIKFTAPVNKGNTLSDIEIKNAIDAAGVVFGIQEGLLIELSVDRKYDRVYHLAKGEPPIDGQNGYLQFFFDKDDNSLAPKWLDDGTVDFRSLNVLKMCYAGFRLVQSVPAVEGMDGTDILGRTIKHKPGKPAPPLPRGKNTEIGDDGTTLIAHINGQIIYSQNKVNISPVYEVKGNVDNSTGDINFIGSVLIKGNVLTGFKVKAAENIEVMGVLEGASLTAGTNIVLHSGVQGMGKAEIKATGDVNAKFIENCTIEAGRNILTSCILHSNIKCGGNITLTGRKALLVGGKIRVSGSLTASIIGSGMATQTEIEVGHDPDDLEDFNKTTAEYNKQKKEYDNISKDIALLQASEEKAPLSEKHKMLLLGAIHTKLELNDQLDVMESRLNELRSRLSTFNGAINAEKLIRSGVNVLIGNAALYVRDDIPSCSLINDNGKIAIRKYSADN